MKIFKVEPAVILATLNSVIALAVSFGLPLTDTQANAAMVIATGVLGLVVAATTRPIAPGVLAAGVGSILTALGAFGTALSTQQIGSIVAFVSIVAGFWVRSQVTPTLAR